MPSPVGSQPKYKIKAFLDEYRDADLDLVVCTGFTSINGLAWLAGQVNNYRRVTLVIGDMRANRFTKGTDADRCTASMFLRGNNVKVHNWYRSKPVKKIAHGKAVVALRGGQPVAALVGSANLTETGLTNNLEMMVRCDPAELPDIGVYITEATRHPPANDKLIGLVAQDRNAPSTEELPTSASQTGCLSALAMIPIHATGSLWHRLSFGATSNSR